METFFIPTESDMQKWITSAVKQAIQEVLTNPKTDSLNGEQFLNRKEIIQLLKISMGTLTNWQRDGLPFHKKGNRVYFLRSEVFQHIRDNKLSLVKGSRQFCEGLGTISD